MRKFGLAACVLFVSFAFVAADEFSALITKIDGKKVTFYKFKKEEGDKGPGKKADEATTMTAADSVKVVKGKFNKEDKKLEVGDPIEGGLEAKVFQDEKGTFARITTEGDKITQIMTVGGGKKKKKKDDVE